VGAWPALAWWTTLMASMVVGACRRRSEQEMAGPQVGDRAPDFTLPRTPDESVTLSDLLKGGPVLLHFYCFDFGRI
jgi:hypothetical protein